MEVIGDPGAPRSVWFLHGILGQGRNWRSFARRLIAPHPDLKAVLPDLRNHGSHAPRPGPHTLKNAAADLQSMTVEHGTPSVVVGHSLGGKVALEWLAQGALAERCTIWVLDSPPGPSPPARGVGNATDPAHILGVLRDCPVPAPSREPVRAFLAEAGIAAPIVAWLLTSLRRGSEGWQWVYDFDGIEQMLLDHRSLDLWPTVETHGSQVQLLRAGASPGWSERELGRAGHAASAGMGWHTLPGVGHWVHVEAPDATLALLAPWMHAATSDRPGRA